MKVRDGYPYKKWKTGVVREVRIATEALNWLTTNPTAVRKRTAILRILDRIADIEHLKNTEHFVNERGTKIWAVKAHKIRLYGWYAEGLKNVRVFAASHYAKKTQDSANQNDLDKAEQHRREYVHEPCHDAEQ